MHYPSNFSQLFKPLPTPKKLRNGAQNPKISIIFMPLITKLRPQFMLKQNHINRPHHPDWKWLMPTVTLSLLSFMLLLTILTHSKSSSSSGSSHTQPNFTHFARNDVGGGIGELGLPILPRFACSIMGTKGDELQINMILQAAYHPRNYYMLHLDLETSDAERLELAKYVKSEIVFSEFGNVIVAGKTDLVTKRWRETQLRRCNRNKPKSKR